MSRFPQGTCNAARALAAKDEEIKRLTNLTVDLRRNLDMAGDQAGFWGREANEAKAELARLKVPAGGAAEDVIETTKRKPRVWKGWVVLMENGHTRSAWGDVTVYCTRREAALEGTYEQSDTVIPVTITADKSKRK